MYSRNVLIKQFRDKQQDYFPIIEMYWPSFSYLPNLEDLGGGVDDMTETNFISQTSCMLGPSDIDTNKPLQPH